MAKADLEEFYTMVAVGDTVRLIGHRDEETARLFGPAEAPAPMIALQPLQVAHVDDVPLASTPESGAVVNATPVPAATMIASMGTR